MDSVIALLAFLSPILLVLAIVVWSEYWMDKSNRGAGNPQIDKDLDWWMTESEQADSPFYRHVCEDMAAYLRDMGARDPHPPFERRYKVTLAERDAEMKRRMARL